MNDKLTCEWDCIDCSTLLRIIDCQSRKEGLEGITFLYLKKFISWDLPLSVRPSLCNDFIIPCLLVTFLMTVLLNASLSV